MNSSRPRVDRLTRGYWRMTGRPVDLTGEDSWLQAPMHDRSLVGDQWLQKAAASWGGVVREDGGGGLLSDLTTLDGPTFDAAELRPEIRDFYEQTAHWRMDVTTRWNPLFRPGGAAISRFFGRRVHQLALPTHTSDVADGIDSRIALIVGTGGAQHAAAWIRTLRSTGDYVYSGCYRSACLPNDPQPAIHVAFPLECGNVQVFLQPRVLPDGALRLSSPAGRFGQAGAYVVVHDRGGAHAARLPIHETFHVFVDGCGTLRSDHRLNLWSAPVVRLHYTMTRSERIT